MTHLLRKLCLNIQEWWLSPAPKDHGEKVKIGVPFQLLRAGTKLASLISVEVQEKGSAHLKEKRMNPDLSKVTSGNLEELPQHLNELIMDGASKEEKMRIFWE